MDGKLISDNIENEGIVEYGINFINCKIIHDRDSTYMYLSSFSIIIPLNNTFQDLFNDI